MLFFLFTLTQRKFITSHTDFSEILLFFFNSGQELLKFTVRANLKPSDFEVRTLCLVGKTRQTFSQLSSSSVNSARLQMSVFIGNHKQFHRHTSYVTLSRGIAWNIRLVTYILGPIASLQHAMLQKIQQPTQSLRWTYAWRMMGRLDVIPSNIQRLSCLLIGCIFYSINASICHLLIVFAKTLRRQKNLHLPSASYNLINER